MNNVINLNRFRKKNSRAEKEKQAEENRAKFGRTKAEKSHEEAAAEHRDAHLDQHKIDDNE